MEGRALVVVALLAAMALLALAYRRWLDQVRHEPAGAPPLPGDLVRGDRTWLLFTTPFCARCGPVEAQLREADPGAHLVRIDATERPDLARRYHVRSAPTVFLADAGGTVRARLVGADAVGKYLTARA